MSRRIDPDLMKRAFSPPVPDSVLDELGRQVALAYATGGSRDEDVLRVCRASGGERILYQWISTIPGLPTLVAACLAVADEVEVWGRDPRFVCRFEVTRPDWPSEVTKQMRPFLPRDPMALEYASSAVTTRLAMGELREAAALAQGLLDVLVMVWKAKRWDIRRKPIIQNLTGQREALISSLHAAEQELAAATAPREPHSPR